MSKRKKQPDRHPTQRVRKTWTRDPSQRAHGTKKGEKGYDRKRDKEEADREVEQDLSEE
jgi:hypothetical protein